MDAEDGQNRPEWALMGYHPLPREGIPTCFRRKYHWLQLNHVVLEGFWPKRVLMGVTAHGCTPCARRPEAFRALVERLCMDILM